MKHKFLDTCKKRTKNKNSKTQNKQKDHENPKGEGHKIKATMAKEKKAANFKMVVTNFEKMKSTYLFQNCMPKDSGVVPI